MGVVDYRDPASTLSIVMMDQRSSPRRLLRPQPWRIASLMQTEFDEISAVFLDQDSTCSSTTSLIRLDPSILTSSNSLRRAPSKPGVAFLNYARYGLWHLGSNIHKLDLASDNFAEIFAFVAFRWSAAKSRTEDQW